MTTATETRFAFGENWRRFLDTVDAERIAVAKSSLAETMQVSSLEGKSFLDIGCGSGLFSLSARLLGATVRSFDYDSQAVACAEHLKAAHLPHDGSWTIERGDALDSAYIASLGQHDVVYSWGVLHHTGAMWTACANAGKAVKPGGLLYISIYNDQGWKSRIWRGVKWLYNHLPRPLRFLLVILSLVPTWGPATILDLYRGRPFWTWRNRKSQRGMSPWHDLIDWVGGYPFEVSSRERIIQFFSEKGFALQKLVSVRSRSGCNQFVFRRAEA